MYHFFVVNQVLLCFRSGGQNWKRTGEPTADHFVSRGGWFSGEFDFNPVIKELFLLVEADRDRPMLIDSIDGMHYVFQIVTFYFVQIGTHIFVYVHSCPWPISVTYVIIFTGHPIFKTCHTIITCLRLLSIQFML